ncbi:hypothetical protein M0813_01234 [Anaeramoeba flamelloides]|uniref:Transmembrane protein n=1 Tax=Anaeramoeba flamelloides TaxID=1746091 RepID=A0ABQ8Z8I1_9EUKA|nr:hypothetical protein M0813_01234 [Anaeramoeba flamelloides]
MDQKKTLQQKKEKEKEKEVKISEEQEQQQDPNLKKVSDEQKLEQDIQQIYSQIKYSINTKDSGKLSIKDWIIKNQCLFQQIILGSILLVFILIAIVLGLYTLIKG